MPHHTEVIPVGLEAVYREWHFAPAIISNGMIYCSGIIGTSADGEAPNETAENRFEGAKSALRASGAALTDLHAVKDPEAQFATAFETLKAVLAAAGADLSDVVEIITYHVDIQLHMATFMRVKDRYLSAPYPAWTGIGVSELVVPGGLMEIRAIAAAPA